MDSLLFLFHPASPGASGCSGSKGHDLGLRDCLFPLDEFDPRGDVRVRLGDHLLHPGMPSFYVVVGSRLVLVEVVSVNRRKIGFGISRIGGHLHHLGSWYRCTPQSEGSFLLG